MDERLTTAAPLILEDKDIERLLILEASDFTDETGWFRYYDGEYPYWGNISGRGRTIDYEKGKFNRYAKLGEMAQDLEKNFIQTVRNNKENEESRCAYACLLMLRYGLRVGNEGSAEGYMSGMKKTKGQLVHTYGITTLLNKHITFQDNMMFLDFVGKEQVRHKIRVHEPFLIEVGKFYHNELRRIDRWLGIDYETLFKFVKKKVGSEFVPKDLRTFCANTTGWRLIKRYLDKPKQEKRSGAKKEIRQVVWGVSKRLGNTPGIAKRAYLDPRMLDWFLGQRVIEEIRNDMMSEALSWKNAVLGATLALGAGGGLEFSHAQENPQGDRAEKIVKTEAPEISMSDVMKYIMAWEGFRDTAYYDKEHVRTIGYGFNLDREGAKAIIEKVGINFENLYIGKTTISRNIAENLMKVDAVIATGVAKKFVSNFEDQPIPVKLILIDMAYNLGPTRLRKFVKFKSALEQKDYNKAADELYNSKWREQTGDRAKHHIKVVRFLSHYIQ